MTLQAEIAKALSLGGDPDPYEVAQAAIDVVERRLKEYQDVSLNVGGKNCTERNVRLYKAQESNRELDFAWSWIKDKGLHFVNGDDA